LNIEQNKNALDKPILAWTITALIIYSVICYSIETLPDLSTPTLNFLYYSEIIIVSIFTVEYLYRIYVTPDRLKFVFSFYGLIDLLAILPFYLATAIDLRSLRLMRLLRLARLLKCEARAQPTVICPFEQLVMRWL
jgi:voltage-gated potassium channel